MMTTDANAPGARPTLGHIRGLDGVRAASVLGIIAFHAGLSSVPGGFYGVDAFFVLSGFLITSLLLKEWGGAGTIRLPRFWAARARRLLPALFLLVAVVGIVMAAVPRVLATPHILGDALSTLFYSSNWYSIHNGVTYFALSSQPSPFLHTWSLAVEEQFYLVWPLVVLGVLTLGTRRRGARHAPGRPPVDVGEGRLGRGRRAPRSESPDWPRRRRLHALFALACFGSLASALLMAVLAPAGYTSRTYYGTDCRAQTLLIGAAIAIGLTLWREGARRRWFVRLTSVLAVAGVLGTAALWATTSQTSAFAFRGGFMVAGLAAGAVVLACAVTPRSVVVRLLELPPLPQLGRISYGVYLWYWPVQLVTTPDRLHWGVYPLFLARVGITVAIAALSYNLVEMPIRRGALRQWRSWVAAPVGVAVAIGAVFASTLVPVGATVLEGTQLRVASTHPVSTPNAPPLHATSDPTTTTTLPKRSLVKVSTTISVQSLVTPALPAVSTIRPNKPVKVLLVGDSMASSLGVGLVPEARQDGVHVVNEGTPGCSLSMQQKFRVLWYTVPPGSPCDAGGHPGSLFDTWRRWVDAYNPDVVVYVARGETFDQEVDGQWEHLGESGFDRYVTRRFRQAVRILGAKGAAVVLATTPYYDSGLSGSGAPWPENNPARVHTDNAIIRSVARAEPRVPGGGKVYVFNLNRVVSPSHQYSATVGPVNVRCSDGVHFTQSGGIFVALRLDTVLVDLGQAHAAASPGGAWPGPLPPSTPTWYAKLPCQ